MPGPAFDSCTAGDTDAAEHDTSTAVSSTIGTAWAGAAVAFGAGLDAATADGADLAARYAAPHRRYHRGEHIAAVLADSAQLARELGLSRDERGILVLAVCAHDVVYDARPGADERASAQWARSRLLAAGVPLRIAARVAELVLATIEHDAPAQDAIADALLDADLAILAASEKVYAAYVEGVRAEYAAVSDADWRAGRRAVLSALVGRHDLFRSEPGRRRWDAAARRNVAAELADLADADRA